MGHELWATADSRASVGRIRRVARAVLALPLCAGGLALLEFLGAGATTAGAANPAPMLYVANPNGNGLVNVFRSAQAGTSPPRSASPATTTLAPRPPRSPRRVRQPLGGDRSGDGVSEFTPTQFASSAAHPTVNPRRFRPRTTEALAFDSAGDLWVTQFTGARRRVHRQASRRGHRATRCRRHHLGARRYSALGPARSTVQETCGWVGTSGADSVLIEYTEVQLASSGEPDGRPCDQRGRGERFGAAFDANGDLWVCPLTLATPAVDQEFDPEPAGEQRAPDTRRHDHRREPHRPDVPSLSIRRAISGLADYADQRRHGFTQTQSDLDGQLRRRRTAHLGIEYRLFNGPGA